jgi:hypothetical protein
MLTPDRTMNDAIARALGGRTDELYALLCRGSGLPGVRANLPLAQAFAEACASDPRAPELAATMARLDADFAPGDTALEFLPVCGVLAAATIAIKQPGARSAMIGVLHDASEDLRFRVRDAVAPALARLGEQQGDALVEELASFMDGYFHAAAALRSLAHREFLARVSDAGAAAGLLSAALDLAAGAPRAAARYPGYKALLDAIGATIEPLALKLGAAIFDVAAGFAKNGDPHLRDLVRTAVSAKKLRARFPAEVRRVEEAFVATDKPLRDPRGAPRPSRKRGGGRRR